MLIVDLDDKKSYFSYCNGNPALSSFPLGNLYINLKGLLEDYLKQTPPSNQTHDKTAIDSNNYYNFRSISSNEYKLKTTGMAVIEPGKINEDDFEKIFKEQSERIRKEEPNEEEVHKKARKNAFEKISNKYSNMVLGLTLEWDIEPLIINGDRILKMGGGGDSYYTHLIMVFG